VLGSEGGSEGPGGGEAEEVGGGPVLGGEEGQELVVEDGLRGCEERGGGEAVAPQVV